ncbi:Protocadherin Fat 4 [Mactra antiquata]
MPISNDVCKLSSPIVFDFQARIKFKEPSLKDNSRIVCYIGQPCTLQLYTTFKTNETCDTPGSTGGGAGGSCGGTDVDNDEGLGYECCEDVISSTNGVTVFPAHARGTSCVTEVTVTYSDPCENSQCQNGGHCFHKDHDDYRCICPDKYHGVNCEKGPCKPEEDHCTNGAYCQLDNRNATCICTAGYTDQHCGTVSATVQQSLGYPVFIDTARPTMYTCVLHQTCSLALMVSAIAGQRPLVVAGYVSPSLTLGEIKLTNRNMVSNSFLAGISLKTSELGIKDACLQTKDTNRISNTTLYPHELILKDRPHFTAPSVPTNTEVLCEVEKPCHVIYHVTSGTGHESECVSYNAKSLDEDFVKYHAYSLTGTCVPGGSNAGTSIIDVSVANSVGDIGDSRTFCVQLGLQGSNITGEERCFTVNVTTQTEENEKTGCQSLHCEHGFCDGHVPESPVCYCQNGFSGQSCDIARVDSAFTGSQTFISDFSTVSELNCQIQKSCAIPFKSLTKPGINPDVSLGYTDSHMIVDKPVLQTSMSKPLEHIGYVSVSSNLIGTYTTCLQVTTDGKVDDEQCVKVTFIDSTSSNTVDETKPYFLIPTMPSDSTILCKANNPCHLEMHFTNGDNFGAVGKCPSLIDASTRDLPGLHIFDSIYLSNECNTDITYVPPDVDGIKTACFQLILPGKKGEKRCYDIKAVLDITDEVISPCKSITCENGGKCIGNPDISMSTGTCVCKSGFYDNTCHTAVDKSTTLKGMENINGLTTGPVHFNSLGGIPELVQCTENSTCCVHISYYSNGNLGPIVGHLGLLTSENAHSITLDHVTGHQVFVQCVTGPPGNHSICFQTTTNGTQEGVNIDEVCVTVNISTESSNTIEKVEPHFNNGYSNGTIVVCKNNSICHIPVITATNGSSCSQVHECGDGVPNLHVFEVNQSTDSDDCITDVALKTGDVGQVDLCISAGKAGETMHLEVHIDNKQEFGPCQKIHCLNGGKCQATSLSDAECICPAGYNGTVCEEDINDCQPDPCQNNATCIDGVDEYTCICLPGFNGTDCEIDIDDCATKPCQNNSTCVDGVGEYTCICLPGFNGTNCEIDIDECLSNPCKNNATCTDDTNDYKCTCMSGFNGTDCNTEIDECESSPCQNGATCIDSINEYTCHCLPGYNGTDCDVDIDECQSNPCKNNATCVEGVNSYTCSCVTGFNGTDCDTDIDECQSNPCKNNATCGQGVNEYICTCATGFTGTDCDTVIQTTESPTTEASTTESTIPTTEVPSTTPLLPTCCSRTHDGVVTNNEKLPPAFIEYTIPEIIRCTVNKSCPILLPVDGQPGITPHVQHGHFDLGLNIKPIGVSSKRGVSCDNTMPRCAYEATITVIPTDVKLYKYCVQTTDNHMINADELCYLIQGVSDSVVTTLLNFVYPPTLPDNSTMSCPKGQTCHYQIEVKRQSGICNLKVAKSELDPGAIKISQFTNTSTSCKYDVALTTPSNETGYRSFCLEAKAGEDPACLHVNIKDKASGQHETCYSLHCVNGGFCDTVADAPSTCLCKPGFAGKQCEIGDSCGISAPDTITCINHQDCEISFMVTGRQPPTFVPDGGEVHLKSNGTEHIVSVSFPFASNASKVCIDVKHGTCNDRVCTNVFFDPRPISSSTSGEFSTGQLQYTCVPNSDCFVTATTNTKDDKCPDILIHKETTVSSYHVFESVKYDKKCKSIIAVTGNKTGGEHQRLCLKTENGSQQCIEITMKDSQESCDNKVATEHARKMVDTGYASCSCVFNGKRLNIIKKRPVPKPEALYKAAGFGAGGMLGTIVIGVIIYAVVSKIKSSPKRSAITTKEKPRPSPRMRQKVHPHKRTHWMY